ncbi:MAG TPA: hypothetical protein VNH18_12620, partial [Bryobacteraceae bacterium]|nr:hypothetical protein [Bryobacteraceae bacterium]
LPSPLWQPMFQHGELRGSIRLMPCAANNVGMARGCRQHPALAGDVGTLCVRKAVKFPRVNLTYHARLVDVRQSAAGSRFLRRIPIDNTG